VPGKISALSHRVHIPEIVVARRPPSERPRIVLAALIAALIGSTGAKAGAVDDMLSAKLGLTERVAVDTVSGFALSGYDPVGYFVDGRPVIGSPAYEAIWNGAAWRFANEGNRAAFLAAPTVYAPRYGGYDATSIAAGIAAPADPTVFLVTAGRLYLFRDETARRAFLASPERAGAAEAAWPALEQRLIR
jgi:hypothetical protein